MSESNGDPLRQGPVVEDKDQSQLSVDARPLSPREQRVQRPDQNIPPETSLFEETQQPGKNIPHETSDSTNNKMFDDSNPPETQDAKASQMSDENISSKTSDSVESRLLTENISEESNIGSKETTVDMPHPGPDWCFNDFLIDLAKKITDKELDVLKTMFTNAGIGRGEQEKLTTPMALFDILRRRLYVNRNNLCYLQTILMKLDRPELIQMTIEYAQKEAQVVHFSKFTEEEVNGYKGFKVHVEGKDFSQCRQSYIEDMRTKVSRLLFIPPQNVLVAGIEPCSSMLITILIPDTYADILENILEHRKEIIRRPLSELSVDKIIFAEKEYSLKDGTSSNSSDDQQETLKKMFEQFQDTREQLENTENKFRMQADRYVELDKKNKKMETELSEKQMDAFRAGATKLTAKGIATAQKLSERLTDSERQTLEKKFPWNTPDSMVMPSPEGSNFLARLYNNGLKKTMRHFGFDQWITECFNTIDRPDLQAMFEELNSKVDVTSLLNQPEFIAEAANFNKKVLQKVFEAPDQPKSSGEKTSTETEPSQWIENVMKTMVETLKPEMDKMFLNKPTEHDSNVVEEETMMKKSSDVPNQMKPSDATVSMETQLASMSEKIDRILQNSEETKKLKAFKLYRTLCERPLG